MQGRCADVVIFSAIPKVLTYRVPDDMNPLIGSRVVIPVRTSRKVGMVIAINEGVDQEGLKPILDVVDAEPLIPREIIELLVWCSRYYHAGIGACLSLAFPPLLRKGGRIDPDRGLLELREKEVPLLQKDIRYTPDQEQAIGAIGKAMDSRRFKSMVLHGITGSGKTEVYLACAMQALLSGRSVIYMVPEIALTPQTIARIRERIPWETALFHSGMSPKARAIEFIKVSNGLARFVLGTRSAIFAPVRDIGLIIVDEEHDGSYKQSDGVPYNARDLALVRARQHNAVVVLGSATPSMDTFSRAQKEAGLITMRSRIGDARLPDIAVIDMRGRKEVLSAELLQAMEDTVAQGEQCLLFINRRGFSAAMVCPGCGKILVCRRCARSLTYHKAKASALCHYCGFFYPVPELCPECGCMDMRPLGLGTERIIEEVQRLLPHGRILQMDSDEITTPNKLARALRSIRERTVDVIVGTQMIGKGHDFPHLTLVGVVHAEQLLYLPDFRAVERTFQQVVQVAGRAGRTRPDTRVLIQTLIPDHPVIRAIARYDYRGMIEAEEQTRREAGFPPFAYMARCIFSALKPGAAEGVAQQVAKSLHNTGVRIMGPAPAPIAMLRGAQRWHILLTASKRPLLHKAIDRLEKIKVPSSVRLKIDVDPYDML